MFPVFNSSVNNQSYINEQCHENEGDEGVSHVELHLKISDQSIPSGKVVHENHQNNFIEDFDVSSLWVSVWVNTYIGHQIKSVEKHEH